MKSLLEQNLRALQAIVTYGQYLEDVGNKNNASDPTQWNIDVFNKWRKYFSTFCASELLSYCSQRKWNMSNKDKIMLEAY